MPGHVTFDQAIALAGSGAGGYSWAVPDGWQQGKGAWGGLIVGAMVSAVEQEQADPLMRVRSVTCEIPLPVLVGPHSVGVDLLRRGSATAHWRAQVVDSGGTVRAMGTVVTASGRDVQAGVRPARHAAETPAHADCARYRLPVPPGPAFAEHLDFRPVSGLPVSGVTEPTSGWAGWQAPVPWSAASTLALVDSWWPAALVAETALRPMATVMFAATLSVHPGDLGEAPGLWFEGRTVACDDGFTTERRALWAPDGRLAVDNLQSIVVIA